MLEQYVTTNSRYNFLTYDFFRFVKCPHIDKELSLKFTEQFANHLLQLNQFNSKGYIERLQSGCEIAPEFTSYLMVCVAAYAERENKIESYWQLWEKLSQNVQEIAIELADNDSEHTRHNNNKTHLVRILLNADTNWQKLDLETQHITQGKELLLKFAKKAGKNPDVFEALAKLIYYFPEIFFDSGINILSKHQKEKQGKHLFSNRNVTFFLGRVDIYTFYLDIIILI